ncbi:MAG: hypothetical protein ABW196_11440 [Solirubrobacterales bacterium]
MRRYLFIAFALAALGALVAPSYAGAFYGNSADGVDGAQLVSADYSRLEQGDDATEFAAISADGRYVAIQTTARNFFADSDPDPPGQYRGGGIFRFDLDTRALQKVADGNLFDEEGNVFKRRGASNPSISADGRFIAFSTAEALLPVDVNDNVDVYVRDMTKPSGDAQAFDLVSARDGGDEPATYGGPSSFPGNNPGADVARGVAISADGQKVAFRTAAPSDLPASPTADIAAGQIFVRDRSANTTTLVTAKRDSGTGQMSTEPAGGAFAAVLSADGSTVAWTGVNAASQTRFLGGENPAPEFEYYLWRRIGDGPTAPTRRITGLADPDDPNCPPDATTFFDLTSTGPCYGPLAEQESIRAGIGSLLPALSGDGYEVAFLTPSGPRGPIGGGLALDLFVTDMSPGVSRKSGTVELTRDSPGDPATSPAVNSVAMSPDGGYLAVVSSRARFTLPTLRLLGAPRSIPNRRELYVIDLQQGTLERAAHSASGGDIEGDVLSGVSISAQGERVAFVSFAGNLFFGDANDRSDAFVVTRRPDPAAGGANGRLGAGGPAGSIEFSRGGPQIGVRASSKSGGVIELTVSVPAAGGIKAVGMARAGQPRKLRTVGTATTRAKGATRSSVRLTIRPVRRYRPELSRREEIPGRVAVTYVAARGGRRAATSIRVAFKQTVTASKPKGSGRK